MVTSENPPSYVELFDVQIDRRFIVADERPEVAEVVKNICDVHLVTVQILQGLKCLAEQRLRLFQIASRRKELSIILQARRYFDRTSGKLVEPCVERRLQIFLRCAKISEPEIGQADGGIEIRGDLRLSREFCLD